MILVDRRVGSKDLLTPLSGHGIEIQIPNYDLPAGDFCFEGKGPGGETILIGVERKNIRDMLNSITTGRFSGTQLVPFIQLYGRQYLVIEGIWRASPRDEILEELVKKKDKEEWYWRAIEINRKRFMQSQLDRFLISIQETTTVKINRTCSPWGTAAHVLNLYHFWNDKEYSQHRANSSRHITHVEILRPWSLRRKWANDLPTIGSDTSRAIESHFNSPLQLAQASISEWQEIQVPSGKKTRRLGKVAAEAIWKVIREE